MKHTNKITEYWNAVLQTLDEEKWQEASDLLDRGIVYLGRQTLNGVTEIDGVSINLWKERFWNKHEITWNVLDPD